MITGPPCLELGFGPQSSEPFEQISQLSGDVSFGDLGRDPEKATSHDSSPATLPVPDCTSCVDWTQTVDSPDSKGPSSAPIVLFPAVYYSELVPPQCALDMEASSMKTDVNLSSAPLSLECQSEPQNNPTLLSVIESACDVIDAHEVSLSYVPNDDDDDETFDYKGIDWEPRASGVLTPPPSAKICTIALPYFSPEKHSRTPSKAGHESTSWSSTTLALSIIYASDDIQVGLKCRNEAKIAHGTRRRIRRASVDDLGGMADQAQVTRTYSSPIKG